MLYITPRASNSLLKLVKTLEKHQLPICVYFPANICYTFPLSCLYSNSTIKLYDISYETLYPDYSSVRLEDSDSRSIKIFVCVIPYGNWDLNQIKDNRQKIRHLLGKETFIVWDCALTFPTYNTLNYICQIQNEYESFVFSFSYAKPIELGFGSAIFTKLNLHYNHPLKINRFQISYLVNKVDKRYKTYLNLFKLAQKRYSFLCYNSELDESDSKQIYSMIEKIASNQDFALTLRKQIKITYFELLDKIISNNRFFKANLEGLGIDFVDKCDISWRFNIRVHESIRDSLIKRIFQNGGYVSRLFPSISHLFNNNFLYPNSSRHWQRIVNIFNNQDKTYNDIVFQTIRQTIQEIQNKGVSQSIK
ncbi:MAG: hypothetical protein ABDH21_00265 [bacterium]